MKDFSVERKLAYRARMTDGEQEPLRSVMSSTHCLCSPKLNQFEYICIHINFPLRYILFSVSNVGFNIV